MLLYHLWSGPPTVVVSERYSAVTRLSSLFDAAAKWGLLGNLINDTCKLNILKSLTHDVFVCILVSTGLSTTYKY